MARYARTLLITLFAALAAFAGFNAAIDPYDVGMGVTLEGVNARKTRAHEDGRRIPVGHALGRAEARSVLLGSSRVVDGFPERIATWPGGLYNAGLRGSNAFELAHAAALAGRDPGLRCIVIGLDMGEFSGAEKYKAAFPVSRLADGSTPLSLGRIALSPNTFLRSLQTVRDNLTGGSDDPPFREVYPAGVQRERFLNTPRGGAGRQAALRIDPARIELLFETLQALTGRGVQIVGFLHPIHAYSEERLFRAGRAQDYFAFRSEMAARFAALTGDPAAPCAPGGAGVLWDFSGFQAPATTPLPGAEQTRTHAAFHEPAHYLPRVGLAMLARMRGDRSAAQGADPAFGAPLTVETAEASARAIEARRAAYLETGDGRLLTRLLDAAGVVDATPPPFAQITPAERRRLRRMSRAAASRAERVQALKTAEAS